jgi:hypothetical protein
MSQFGLDQQPLTTPLDRALTEVELVAACNMVHNFSLDLLKVMTDYRASGLTSADGLVNGLNPIIGGLLVLVSDLQKRTVFNPINVTAPVALLRPAAPSLYRVVAPGVNMLLTAAITSEYKVGPSLEHHADVVEAPAFDPDAWVPEEDPLKGEEDGFFNSLDAAIVHRHKRKADDAAASSPSPVKKVKTQKKKQKKKTATGTKRKQRTTRGSDVTVIHGAIRCDNDGVHIQLAESCNKNDLPAADGAIATCKITNGVSTNKHVCSHLLDGKPCTDGDGTAKTATRCGHTSGMTFRSCPDWVTISTAMKTRKKANRRLGHVVFGEHPSTDGATVIYSLLPSPPLVARVTNTCMYYHKNGRYCGASTGLTQLRIGDTEGCSITYICNGHGLPLQDPAALAGKMQKGEITYMVNRLKTASDAFLKSQRRTDNKIRVDANGASDLIREIEQKGF